MKIKKFMLSFPASIAAAMLCVLVFILFISESENKLIVGKLQCVSYSVKFNEGRTRLYMTCGDGKSYVTTLKEIEDAFFKQDNPNHEVMLLKSGEIRSLTEEEKQEIKPGSKNLSYPNPCDQ